MSESTFIFPKDIVQQEFLNAFQIPYIFYDDKKQIKHMYLTDSLNDFNIKDVAFREFVEDIFKQQITLSKAINIGIDKNKILVRGTSILSTGNFLGVLIVFQIPDLNAFEEYQNMAVDLKVIFESSYDVIFVADGHGTALRVSSACEKFWGIKKEDFIGSNVFKLEEEGVFSPSVTRMVLEQKKKISTIQKTNTERTLLVVGTPIFDEGGNVKRIVNASRDITEIDQLQKELNEMKEISARYQGEIKRLKGDKVNIPNINLVYKSQIMQNVIDQIKRVANYDSNVLILGESGVGKEIIATLIHEYSNRINQPFVKINCGAIPESLLESELFGYEKGTFTGANKEGKDGLFLAANNGTILLDEITEMSMSLQVKLLRVLQEREIRRVGSVKPIKINVRVISSTNKNIKSLIQQEKFRGDLYYRLNVFPIEIPPLRERKEDIPILTKYFIDSFNKKYKTNKKMNLEAIQDLLKYPWEGNVRELQHYIERILIMSNNDTIGENEVKSTLLINDTSGESSPYHFEIFDDINLYDTLNSIEREILSYALSKYKSTVEMAKVLNVSQSTISKKLNKFGISIYK